MSAQNQCFICLSKIVVNGNGKKFSSSVQSVFNSELDLDSQLDVIFILRHILQLKSEQLHGFLRRCGNPRDWIELCEKCKEQVHRIRSLFQRLQEISREFEKEKWEIQEKIRSSEERKPKEKKGRGRKRKLEEKEEVYECRKVICAAKKKAIPSTQNPFHDGDVRAKAAAAGKSLNVQNQIKVKVTDGDKDDDDDDGLPVKNEPLENVSSPAWDTDSFIVDNNEDNGGLLVDELELADAEVRSFTDEEIRSGLRRSIRCGSSKRQNYFEEEDDDDGASKTDAQLSISPNPSPVADKGRQSNSKAVGNRREYKCELCTAIYAAANHLRRHMHEVHGIDFQKEEKVDNRPRPFICPEDGCNRAFYTKSNLAIHRKIRHSNDSKWKVCPCGKRFWLEEALKRHSQKCNKIKLKCLLCDATFVSLKKFHEHKKKAHGSGGNNACICEECGKTFKNKASLAVHYSTRHKNKKEAENPCEVCERKFTSKPNLKLHLARVHGIGDFKCDVEDCGEVFTKVESLNHHKSIWHDPNVIRQCKSGTSYFGLPRKATAPEDLECPQCKKTFGSKDLRNAHVRRVHENERVKKRRSASAGERKPKRNEEREQGPLVCDSEAKQDAIIVGDADAIAAEQSFITVNEVATTTSSFDGDAVGADDAIEVKREPILDEDIFPQDDSQVEVEDEDVPSPAWHTDGFYSDHDEEESCDNHELEVQNLISDENNGENSSGMRRSLRAESLKRKSFQEENDEEDGDFDTRPIVEEEGDATKPERKTGPRLEKPHKCEICEGMFGTLVYLKMHMREKHGISARKEAKFPQRQRRFPCSEKECSKTFKNRNLRNAHIHSVHGKQVSTETDPEICQLCGKSCRNKISLRSHLSTAHQIGEHKCEECDVVYADKRDLKRHMYEKHGIEPVVPVEEDQGTTTKPNLLCEFCVKTFAGSRALALHKRLVHRKEFKKTTIHSCEICGVSRRDRKSLRHHRAVVHHIGGVKCPRKNCTRVFLNEKDLRDHIRHFHLKIMRPKPHKCDLCGKCFQALHLLRLHVHSVHLSKGSKRFQCDLCGNQFDTERSYRRHLICVHKIPHTDLQYDVPDDDDNYKNSKEVDAIIGVSSSSEFKCDICSRTFSTSAGLTNHRRLAHDIQPQPEPDPNPGPLLEELEEDEEVKEEPKFKCNICGKGFNFQDSLSRHLGRKHKVIPTCDLCGLTFDRPFYLRRHLALAHQIGDFKCDREGCGKVYSYQKDLDDHVKKKHGEGMEVKKPPKRVRKPRPPKKVEGDEGEDEDVPNFKCTESGCNKPFNSMRALTHHLSLIHHIKPSLTCDICGITWRSHFNLRRHQAAVHNMGDYECKEEGCDKRCFTQKELDDHRRYAHEGYEKPRNFTCSFCPKAFQFLGNVQKHEKTMHLFKGSKDVICELCGKGYNTDENCRRHQKKVHGISRPVGRTLNAKRKPKLKVNVNDNDVSINNDDNDVKVSDGGGDTLNPLE